MNELQIERTIDNRKITVTLTDDELEKAYRIMERRYLDEDFANALADAVLRQGRNIFRNRLIHFAVSPLSDRVAHWPSAQDSFAQDPSV